MLQRKALQRCMQLSTRGLAAQRPGLPRAPSARCGCATVVVALATERDPRTENKGLDRDNALYVDSTCIGAHLVLSLGSAGFDGLRI